MNSNPSIDVVVTPEVRRKLDDIALERGKGKKLKVYAGDIVREALQEYFDRRGIEIRVEVDRGGDRRNKKG